MYLNNAVSLKFVILLFINTISSQRLPYYGNLHPLNFGENHCGPDISTHQGSAPNIPNSYARFQMRNELNKHLIYRDSRFFNRRRWNTG